VRKAKGPQNAVREALDVAHTFTTYASCLAEVLGGTRGRAPRAVVNGQLHVIDALADGRGVIFATAHTAGWETVGQLLAGEYGLRVMIVERKEEDSQASNIQDAARRAQGLLIVQAGDDPLAALPLVRHLRERGVVALQLDRAPLGMRSRPVVLFGAPGRIPEGPLKLASLTRAPIVPLFCSRRGHRSYAIDVMPALRLAKGASDAEVDAAAQSLATSLENFVKAHPTQWFHFRPD
jgi:phosphatidylinositol dimannoside acyltransferase